MIKPPQPPLDRIVHEGVGVFCHFCGSTKSKKGFLGIFGKRSCDNSECRKTNSLDEVRSEKIKTIFR